jgi:hypothetical protein
MLRLRHLSAMKFHGIRFVIAVQRRSSSRLGPLMIEI